MKLRSRILLISLPISIVSIIMLEIASFYFVQKELIAQLTGRTDMVVKYLGNEIKTLISSSASTLEQYADFPIFVQYTKYVEYDLNEEAVLAKKQISITFEKLLKRNRHYAAILYHDKAGKRVVIEKKNVSSAVLSSKLSYDPFPERAEMEISRVLYDGPNRQHLISLRFGIRSSQERYGSLTIFVLLDSLLDGIYTEKVTVGSTAFVFDDRANLIYTSQGATLPLRGHAVDMIYSAYRSIPLVNWNICVGAPRGELFVLLRKLELLAASVITLAIIGKVIFLGYLSGWISKPVQRLLHMMQTAVSGQEEDSLAGEKRWVDEFRQIAITFREMCSKMREMQDRLIKKTSLVNMGRMAAQIAHDMRSPLSVLREFVSVSPTSDTVDAEFKAAASRSTAKLLHMADELVNYSKAAQATCTPVSLHELIHEMVGGEVRLYASEKNVEFDYAIDDTAMVNVDAQKIGRALVNLANNAVQAVAQTQGRITMISKIVHDTNLVIRVEDNGCGIAPEDIPHIFESFFTKGKKGGTGLGLSYCKNVVEAHGGQIEVESTLGKGTTFTISIPGCVIQGAVEGSNEDTNM